MSTDPVSKDSARLLIIQLVEDQKRFTYEELSKGIGRNYAYIQQWAKRGKRPLPEDERKKLAVIIGRPEEDLRQVPKPDAKVLANPVEGFDPSRPITGISARHPPPNARPLSEMPRIGGKHDVPVLGRAQGGPDGALKVDNEPIDRVSMVPDLVDVPDGYALFVDGNSMEDFMIPHGSTVYVHPYRRPQAGCPCVLRTVSGLAYIKRFVKTTPTKVIVEQSNPRKLLEFNLSDVDSIQMVVNISYTR